MLRALTPLIGTCLAIITLLLGSCSLSGPLRVDSTAKNYNFPPPAAGWTKLTPREDAEIIYQHQKSGALLSVSSICERYEEVKLETLARSALSPIEKQKDKAEASFSLSGREAFQLYVEGKVDGVAVEIDFVSWRKNDCLFDFSVQAAPALPPPVREDFLNMVKKFRY